MILLYLKQHYDSDKEVLSWLQEYLKKDDVLFHYYIALILKYFPHLDFNNNVFNKYFDDQNSYWLVQYYMLFWLDSKNKFDILNNLSSENYYINRELNFIKYNNSNDWDFKNNFIWKLYQESSDMRALQGWYIFSNLTDFHSLGNFKFLKNRLEKEENQIDPKIKSHFLKPLISQDEYGERTNYICRKLDTEFRIHGTEIFFNEEIWSCPKEFKELKNYFMKFNKMKESDPPNSLQSLHNFNHIMLNRLSILLNFDKIRPSDSIRILHDNFFKETLPRTSKVFSMISNWRAQTSRAHPYDRKGNFSTVIKFAEFKKLIALEEIVHYVVTNKNSLFIR